MSYEKDTRTFNGAAFGRNAYGLLGKKTRKKNTKKRKRNTRKKLLTNPTAAPLKLIQTAVFSLQIPVHLQTGVRL